MEKIKVAVNGYGVIGKRVADAVRLQPDMELIGVCDIVTDWRIKVANAKGIPVFSLNSESYEMMRNADVKTAGILDDLLKQIDIVVDCSKGEVGTQNVERYRKAGIKFIRQGSEKHETTGHSFAAEANYNAAPGKTSARVVSCDTTSIVKTLTALKKASMLKNAKGTKPCRAANSWKSHQHGITNTLVPEEDIPSHRDAKSVAPGLNVVTTTAKYQEAQSQFHYWVVSLAHPSSREEMPATLRTSSRISLVRHDDGLSENNAAKKLVPGMGISHGDSYEVAIVGDMLKVECDELHHVCRVNNKAIVISENTGATGDLPDAGRNAEKSSALTNKRHSIHPEFFNQPNLI